MSDTILVTGGAGFIGSNLVHALCAGGHSVRVLDNLSTGHQSNLDGLDVDFCEADLRDADAVRSVVQGASTVFHLAALPSVERSVREPISTHDVNVNGTLTLLNAARNESVDRFVLSSSSSVYGNTRELPKREDMRPFPLSPYALSKLVGEEYCSLYTRLYGLKTYSLRYFNVFGPRQDPNSEYAAVIPLFIRILQSGKAPEVHGDGNQTRDFTFVEDVVQANLACMDVNDAGAGQSYNIARGDRLSILDLVEQIANILGVEVNPVFSDSRVGDVRDSQADITRAQEALGWNPRVSFADGLRETISWFTGNNC